VRVKKSGAISFDILGLLAEAFDAQMHDIAGLEPDRLGLDVGYWARSDDDPAAPSPSPLAGEGARRADEGFRTIRNNECLDGPEPLTLEILLNEEFPVPLPQGERGRRKIRRYKP
jgi:hypothetical protein